MTWSAKRQFFYGGIACFAVALFLLINIYPKLNKAPTCFDTKQNGTETGIDCGGGCERICQAQTVPLVVKWSRSFKVGDGFYNAFAYVENQNLQASSKTIGYEFTFYDANNIFISSRKGYIYVPANGRFGIFEPAVSTGNRVPKNTTFRFLTTPEWLKVTDDESKQTIFSEAGALANLDLAPRLPVDVSNPTTGDVRNIDVYAIVYDQDDNALGVSKTLIDILPANSKKSVTFTWREPFNGEARRTEIITQVNVFANRTTQ